MSTTPELEARPRLRVKRLVVGALVLVVIGAAAALAGWDPGTWLKELWHSMRSIPLGDLLAGVALITIQTTTTAYAWFAILRFAYPREQVLWIQVLACYAAAVALNWVLPANLGTLTMMLMFVAIIPAAKFAGILGGFAVQKIFFTLIGTAVYLYLFLTVGGSFDLQFGFISAHPWAFVILLAASAMLVYLVIQPLKDRVRKWWGQAKEGGQILVHPRAFLGRVVLPEAISWLAMLGILAVFLSAYDIPVTFHTLMRVVAGNSIANATSVTPGGAGVVQGFNVLSLKGITSAANANAYSVTQQIVQTAWSILLAIALLVRAFGWTGGKALVGRSYSEARERTAEQSAARKARKAAKKASRHGDADDAGEPLDAPGATR